jgi:peptide/nickel transport system substrate-binding protein
LVIGAPEGAFAGTEQGFRALAAGFSREGLTQLAADGRVLPRLAEGWQWEADGRRLRVRLRDGIKFHDGTPLDAALATKLFGEAVKRPGNRAQYPSLAYVVGVHPEGASELVVELTEPSSFLPEDLELPLTLGPQNATGAFRIVRMEDSEVELQAFKDYYLGAPYIQRVTMRPFRTLRTAWTSLLRGEIDMVTNVPPDAVDFVRNQDVQVVSVPRRFQFMLAFNSRRPPLNNSAVRRALNHAVDRDVLIRNVMDGNGTPSTGPFWPRHWAFDTSIQPYSYDPALTISRLEEAGFRLRPAVEGPPTRLKFTCVIPANFSIYERVALEVQRQLYNVGVDMQFRVLPPEQFDGAIRQGDFDAALIDMISGPTIGRAYIFWRSAKTFQGLNVFGYENAEVEKLFDSLRLSSNEAAVRSIVSRLQRAVGDDPPAVFLAWSQGTRAIRREFGIVEEADSDPIDTIWRWHTRAERANAVATTQ